jgi:triosephosphate isomerase
MAHKFIVGNWKMHTTAREAVRLAQKVLEGVGENDEVAVTLCPPFVYLAMVGQVLRGSHVGLGAQNLYPEPDGAFTGEVSAAMLLDVGCTYVILGHSERRHVLGETDAFINQKVRFALTAGLDVILCVGETLDQRIGNQTEALLERQITTGLAGVPDHAVGRVSIAYEPVWAIGNPAHHATPQQAQDAHAIIRRRVGQLFGQSTALTIAIQYGGSVKPDNAATFLCRPGVDGALVGGASLHADPFLAIVRAAATEAHAAGDAAARRQWVAV